MRGEGRPFEAAAAGGMASRAAHQGVCKIPAAAHRISPSSPPTRQALEHDAAVLRGSMGQEAVSGLQLKQADGATTEALKSRAAALENALSETERLVSTSLWPRY